MNVRSQPIFVPTDFSSSRSDSSGSSPVIARAKASSAMREILASATSFSLSCSYSVTSVAISSTTFLPYQRIMTALRT